MKIMRPGKQHLFLFVHKAGPKEFILFFFSPIFAFFSLSLLYFFLFKPSSEWMLAEERNFE